jgi:ABC-2 type transport system ATP-binding protein
MIEIEHLTKTYTIPLEKKDSLKSYFLNPFHRNLVKKYDALNDISLFIKKGEFLGVIGRNGSGKSTLLKILSGVYLADKGKVKVQGSLVPFLELGVGFNPELTGRENIFLNGLILGMTRKYLEEKFLEIVEFSEIGQFLDAKVKNYSSGMTLRLAFSVAMQLKADIYILDEIIAVGDEKFRRKGMSKIKELSNAGVTFILVSHDLGMIAELCNRAIVIEKGKIQFDGDTQKALEFYSALNNI